MPCWQQPAAGQLKAVENEYMAPEDVRCFYCLAYLENGGVMHGACAAAASGADTNAANGGTRASASSGSRNVNPARNSPGSAAPQILDFAEQLQNLRTHVECLARRVEALEEQRADVVDLVSRIEAVEQDLKWYEISWR